MMILIIANLDSKNNKKDANDNYFLSPLAICVSSAS